MQANWGLCLKIFRNTSLTQVQLPSTCVIRDEHILIKKLRKCSQSMIWTLLKHESVKPAKYTRIAKQLQETLKTLM